MTETSGNESFFAQLKRRRVVRAAIGYAAAVFVVLQLADILFPALGIPEPAFRFLVILCLVGFPAVLVLSWMFEISPEGLRLASKEGRVVLRVRPWMMFATGGLLLLVLLAGAALWVRPHLLAGEVTPGADVIAVVPFTTSGTGVEPMGEGLVDLLSRNLDEVGAIRTVDPRTVLHRWRQRAGMRAGAGAGVAAVTGEEILQIGREVGAGSVLTGSVIAAAGRVRISADLLALDGSRLATAAVDGEEHRVLELVDSLSVLLLREIWRGGGPAPGADISAISTSNLTAIRAFLAGEQYYRQSDWTGAFESFERAVEADSTFALAYYRLSRVVGWSGHPEELLERFVELAARFADRLPGRTRKLLLAEQLMLRDRGAEAVDTLRALAQRYPDDPEVWQALADAEYHRLDEGALLAARPLTEQVRGFERVLALDPAYVPAMIHPLEIAFLHGDTARIRRYTRLLSAVPAVSPIATRVLDEGTSAMANPHELVGLISALSISIRTLERPVRDLGWQAARAAFEGLRRLAATLPAEESAVVVHWLRTQLEERDEDYGARAVELLLDVLAASGRLEAAGEVLTAERLGARLPEPTGRRYQQLPTLAGYVESGLGEGATNGDRASSIGEVGAALVRSIDRGDVRAIGENARRLAEFDPTTWAAATTEVPGATEAPGATGTTGATPTRQRRDTAFASAVLRVAAGFTRALEGRPEAGLEEVEAALRARRIPRGLAEALWFRWLERLSGSDDTRPRAISLLRSAWSGAPIYEVRRSYLLARALEAEGQEEAARIGYARYAGILADADPDLRIRPEIEHARRRAVGDVTENATRR